VRVSPEDYDKVVATYKTPIVSLLEYGLVAAILFHALNGLRLIAVDFWSKGPRYQKQMLWSVVTVWVLLMIGAIYPVLNHAYRVLFGS
jgi:succinate dehydrogenase / fumarate reductase cytochrome b subunit